MDGFRTKQKQFQYESLHLMQVAVPAGTPEITLHYGSPLLHHQTYFSVTPLYTASFLTTIILI